jgi:metal-sulfur cluster biosynthetic enzyme
MFAAPQCFGYRGEHGKPTQEMCYPPDDVIVKQVKKAVKKVKAKSVFVGTDSRDLIDKMSKVIKGVSIVIKCDSRDLIQHYVIKLVSDLQQVSGFLLVPRFSPPIKLAATIKLRYC